MIGFCKVHQLFQRMDGSSRCPACETEEAAQKDASEHVFVLAQDVATERDFTATTLLDVRYQLARIKKLVVHPHSDFSVIMADTKRLYDEYGCSVFQLDQTGQGVPIVQWYASIGLQAVGKTFTHQNKWDMRNYTRKLMQDKMLILPRSGPFIAELKAQMKEQELITARKKVPAMDHPSGQHDDALWSLCLACDAARPWLTERRWTVTVRQPQPKDLPWMPRQFFP